MPDAPTLPSTYELVKALRWAVRDGRAHGVSACVCVRCNDARATLARYERATAPIDGSDDA